MYTEKGLQKFNGDENFDIEEFNNKNMDRVDELLVNDDVVDIENDLPVAGSLYENKVIKIKANNVQKKCLKIKEVTYNFDDIAYTDVTEATKTGTGYEHCTDSDKYYKDGVEIEVNIVSTLPTPDSSTVGKYYLVGTTLSIGIETPAQYAWVNAGQGNTREVTIPATGWETVSDGTANYYTIEINVEGMTSGFVGSSATDYVRPNPYNVAENDTRADLFSLITNIESMEGKIKVYVNEIPLQPFNIILFGV